MIGSGTQYASDLQTSAQTDTSIIATPGADRALEILGVFISADGDADVFFEQDSTVVWKQFVAERGGSVAPSGAQPWFTLAANKALTYTFAETVGCFIGITYRVVDI